VKVNHGTDERLSRRWIARFVMRLNKLAPNIDAGTGVCLVRKFSEQAVVLCPEEAADVVARMLRQDEPL
jgi:hypothetical protein